MSYFYKYRRSESCLPDLADYIQKNGNVILAVQCEMIREKPEEPVAKNLLLSLDDISLPTAFFMEESDRKAVQDKVNEFYKHGDFLQPLIVKRTRDGYILSDQFEQYRAAKELDITECLCRVLKC